MDEDTQIVLKDFLVAEIPKRQPGITNSFRITVPAQYIMANLDTDEFFVRMLQPPFNSQDDTATLKQFLTDSHSTPPDSWPLFKCLIIYQADTFNEAESNISTKKPNVIGKRPSEMLEHKRIIDVQQSLVDVPLLDGINIPDLQLNKETMETDQLLEPNEEQIPTLQGSLLAEEISFTNDEHLDAVNEQPSPVTKDSSLQESSQPKPPAILTPLPALLDSPSPTRATSSPALLDTAPPATLTPAPQDSPASVQASLTTKKRSLAKVSKNSLEDQADPLAGFLKSFSKNIKEQLSAMKTTLSTKINALDVKLIVMQKDVDEIKTFIMESRQMTKNKRLVAFQT